MSSKKMDLKTTKKILSILIVVAFIFLVLGVIYWNHLPPLRQGRRHQITYSLKDR